MRNFILLFLVFIGILVLVLCFKAGEIYGRIQIARTESITRINLEDVENQKEFHEMLKRFRAGER